MHNITLEEALDFKNESIDILSRMVSNSAFAQHLLEAAHKNNQVVNTNELTIKNISRIVVCTKEDNIVTLLPFVADLIDAFLIYEDALSKDSFSAIFFLKDPSVLTRTKINDNTLESYMESLLIDITNDIALANMERMQASINN
jgi:hypothetical protein